jgi:uncharacterized protein (TIGR00369 family)
VFALLSKSAHRASPVVDAARWPFVAIMREDERLMVYSRTITWSPPADSMWTGRPLNAVDHLLAIRSGRVPKPPLYELLRIDVVEARTGYVTLSLTPDESFTSPLGTVGGGIILTILDTTLAWTCDTMATTDRAGVTVELKANFLRPISTNAAPLKCEAECVFTGSRVVVGQAKLRDHIGTICAIATATFLLIERETNLRQPEHRPNK